MKLACRKRKSRERLMLVLALASMTLFLASCAACSSCVDFEGPPPKVHTDLEPLRKRLALPSSVAAARWVAQSSRDGNQFPPAHNDVVFIIACIVLTQEEWSELGDGAERSTDAATIRLPKRAARLILPNSILAEGREGGGEIAFTGKSIDASRLLVRESNATVRQAARLGNALVIELLE